ncbi:MAG: glycerol-3-phosphate dehydrogenase/oxidase [Sedimentisphaerales bacterium]|nr:glycerol-3-phosphate dehydrogenase/oxidase [Sedimentisphaerales bacterium]
MLRDDIIAEIECVPLWDIVVIGGGATGMGCAVDAASRGYKTLLLEQDDFAKGTSSRSTKLAHGGVRYLKQGDIALVIEALRERGLMLKNAAHMVRKQAFVIPIYKWLDIPMYLIGLKMYDILSGRLSFGASRRLSPKNTVKALPTIRQKGLRGGIRYYDGQFDDARLAINLAQTCVDYGGSPLNYFRVDSLGKSSDGRLESVNATDLETQTEYNFKTKAVLNCTGVFADKIMHMDDPSAPLRIKPSQGVHLMLDKKFLASDTGIMIPKTSDGRVLFVLPWQGVALVGTTDTQLDDISLEPRALDEEVEFILNNTKEYLTEAPTRADVRCIYAGLRPLAAPQGSGKKTKEISRNHKITVSDSGLITVLGGKWTTYRKMAQDMVDKAIVVAKLQSEPCCTKELKIHGWSEQANHENHMYLYGSDIIGINKLIEENPSLAEPLHKNLPFIKAEVIWSIRHEMARTVEDILARRQRALILDAQASMEIAPQIAAILAEELGRDENWVNSQIKSYRALAKEYFFCR